MRQYARRIVREHRQLQAEAGELPSARGVPLPAAHDYAGLRRLERLAGVEFDRAYIELTTRRHAQLVRLLERAESRAADAALQAFARRALPVVRSHQGIEFGLTPISALFLRRVLRSPTTQPKRTPVCSR